MEAKTDPQAAKTVFAHDEVFDKKSHHQAEELDAADEARIDKVRRMIDIRLLPVLTILYLMSFLDRGNIGNARVAGLEKTLNLTPEQYNLCLTIFFFPYSLFEVPSNIVLKLLRPTIWLPILVLSWGTVMTLMGIVQNYAGLLATRFFLGFTEAGLFPAASFILTNWYCRHEIQTRLAAFYCAATLAGAFSGLLAFAIEKMDGIGGLEGWRWIFILEGLATVVLGIALPFILIDNPDRAKFLSEHDKTLLIKRLRKDYGHDTEDVGFKWKYLRDALTDWKIYFCIVLFWGNSITAYGFIFTLPTAIAGLGYSSANAQLLTIPIYVVALIFVLISAYYADKTKQRAPFVIYPFTVCAIGFIILIALPKDKWPGARYFMLFVVAGSLYPTLCGLVAWNANNLAGSWKRAIGMALQLTVGNLGGAVGSNIYLSREAPRYWTGYGVSLGVLVMAIIAGIILRIKLKAINAERDKMTTEEIYARYTPAQLADMGDKSPLFRYTL